MNIYHMLAKKASKNVNNFFVGNAQFLKSRDRMTAATVNKAYALMRDRSYNQSDESMEEAGARKFLNAHTIHLCTGFHNQLKKFVYERNLKMDDRFIWNADDLEIEDPIGSGQFIPLREFNKRIAGEEARVASEEALREENEVREITGERGM